MRGRGIVLRDRKFEWHWRQGGPDCTAIGHLYIWNPKKGPSPYAIVGTHLKRKNASQSWTDYPRFCPAAAAAVASKM